MRRPLRVALIGWGAISRRVASLLEHRRSGATIVAVGVRDATRERDLPAGAKCLALPAQLREFEIDVVAEAAGRAAVEPWGDVALGHARAYAVSSTSAFCEPGVLDRLLAAARAGDSQLLVSPGAVGATSALAAASVLPIDEVTHSIIKPPAAWLGTLAEQLVDLEALHEATAFFSGTAREAASRFPQNANVAVVTALAGVGLDRTQVKLVADPMAKANHHRLSAKGEFGRLEIVVESRALAENPKSSEMAALSLLRIIESRTELLVR